MPNERYDVFLFGFRNDVARARTIEFLDRLPAAAAGPARFGTVTEYPARLFAGVPAETALPLQAALTDLGAQVAVLAATASTGGAVECPPPTTPVAPRAAMSLQPLTLTVAAVLGALVYLWGGGVPLLRPAQPPPLAAPAALRPAPVEAEPRIPPEAVHLNNTALRLADTQEFRDAIATLERARRLDPDNAVLTRNLQTVWLNWGIAALSAGELADAEHHLRAAANLGERADVWRALGVAQLRQADYSGAVTALERALRLEPRDSQVMLALAEAYMRQDKRPEALDLLQRAKEAGAGGDDLDLRLARLSREVDTEWDFVQRDSPHFRVSFADSEDRAAVRLVLAAFEAAYASVGARLKYYPGDRTAIVLYAQRDFHDVTQTPDWAGAAFDGRIKVPVRGLHADDADLERVARHEYAHSVIARLSQDRCPVWLNEGLAVWAEEAADGDRRAWAHATIAGAPLFSLDQLSGSFVQLSPARAQVAYAQSYLAVRSLVDDFGARRIPALLEALADGRGLADAYAAVYPGDLAGFEDRLRARLGS